MARSCWATPKNRWRVFAKCGGVCYWCGARLTQFQIDHVLPISRGGEDDLGNVVATCISCHRDWQMPMRSRPPARRNPSYYTYGR